MKRILLVGLCILLFAIPSFAETVAIYTKDKAISYEGFSIFGADDDMSTSATLVTELDTTYAQTDAEDTLEIVSSDDADITQTVTITGIDDEGNRVTEALPLDTVKGSNVETTSTTFRYVDQVSVDTECAGVITVRDATDDNLITSIPIGALEATMVQHFNGEKDSYITGWRANVTSTTGTVLFQLRWYPDDADCLDPTDGYKVLDEIQFTNVLGSQDRPFPQPIKCPAGGWIAVYSTAGTDDADGSVLVQGFDW